MQILKQSTAWTAIVGPILDSAGAEYTGAVIGDLSISKNGTEAAMASAATLTHVSNGFYTLVGTTGNSDTLGALTIRCNKATYQMPPKEYTVLAAAAFDVLVTNGTIASTTNITGGTITTATNVTTVNGLANNVITAASTAADFVTEIQTAITGGAYDLDTDANGRIRIVDGTGTGELDTSSGAVLVYDFTTAAKAILQAEAEDALVAHRLDELLNADSDIDGAAPPTVGSVFHELLSKTAGSFTFDQTTDSLEALRDRGDAAWITATGFSTHSAADVWAVVARTLTAATNITSTGGTTVPQTGDSFAVVNSGTFGNSALNTDLDALLTRLTSTRAGYLDNLSAGSVATAAALDAVDNFVDTEITEILSRIGSPAVSLTADIAALNDITADEVWAAGTRTLTAGTNIVLAKGTGVTGFTDLSAAQVNAEVVDALATDTYALPGQIAPSATPTLSAVLMQLFQLATNKTEQISTTQKIYDRAGSTVMQKRTVSDDGTTLAYGVLSVGP